MKIQDALKQNLEFWQQELTRNQGLAAKHIEEAQKYNEIALEAQQQIALYTKAGEILASIDPVQADKIDVAVSDEIKTI